MAKLIIAAEIQYKDLTVSPQANATAYMADRAFVTKSTDTLANTYFAGRMGAVSYRALLGVPFWGSGSSIAIGAITLINSDGALDGWRNFEFKDHQLTIKMHQVGQSYDSATTLLKADIEDLKFEDEKRIRIVLRDPAADLVLAMNTAVYASGDAQGQIKPIAFGQPEMCSPVLVSANDLEYDLSDAALLQTVRVYDQGVEVDFTPTSLGFRLLANPAGKITAVPLTSGTGADPILESSETEYHITDQGRSISCFNDGESPRVSHEYAHSWADYPRSAADGGKYYFEAVVTDLYEPASIYDPTFGGVKWMVSVGLAEDDGASPQAADITNPQDPKDPQLYCLGIGHFYSSGTMNRRKTCWTKDVERDTDQDFGASAIGFVVGVLVNFDANEIDFYINNAAITGFSNGPYSLDNDLYFPVAGAVDTSDRSDGANDDNVIGIRLIEDDFTYSIPTGYEAWAPGVTADTGFSELVDSITDRVSGLTFNAASVATLDALATGSPQVKYTYGYYLDSATAHTPAQVLNWALAAIGGYWFVNRSAEVQVGQLKAPATSVRSFGEKDFIGDISVSPDLAPALTDGAGYKRNWSIHTEGEIAGSVTETFKAQITRQYQGEYRTSQALAGEYGHAVGADFSMSLLLSSADAEVEADRIATLYSVRRNFWKARIAMSQELFDDLLDELGDTHTLTADRFGLDNGVDLVLVGVEGIFLDNVIELTWWG